MRGRTTRRRCSRSRGGSSLSFAHDGHDDLRIFLFFWSVQLTTTPAWRRDALKQPVFRHCDMDRQYASRIDTHTPRGCGEVCKEGLTSDNVPQRHTTEGRAGCDSPSCGRIALAPGDWEEGRSSGSDRASCHMHQRSATGLLIRTILYVSGVCARAPVPLVMHCDPAAWNYGRAAYNNTSCVYQL